MSVGLAAATANGILDAIFRGVSFSIAAVWIKPHIGDPGAAGTSNVAVETTRKQATFGNAANGGAIANTTTVTWSSVAGAEDWTHFSVWTLSSGGTFVLSGLVTANALQIGDDFVVASTGAFTSSFTLAA
jgi:hypothetical protein